MDYLYLIEKLILIVIIFGLSLGIAMYSTFFERRFAAFFQDRVGPNRAGPLGILQPLADGGKLFFKEEIIPAQANTFLFILGPSLSMLAALMTSAVIPWGTYLEIYGRNIELQITDINIGILYVFGVIAMGVYGIMIGGWASNNKFALLGAIRAASQNISYELAMGLSLIAVIMITGTLSLKEMAAFQAENVWMVVLQPLGFLIFLVCAFAETNRAPFDLPECETELIGGFHTEYSSMKLGFYLFAEYIHMFISSAILATLYFGSYSFPGVNYLLSIGVSNNVVSILGIVALFLKIFFFIFLFMWVRWTLPRFRYDQLMRLGWQVLIPLSIINIVVTGVVITLFFN